MKLHLGVHDIPYVDAGATSTGEVAQILEDRYGVMDSFVFLHKEDITEAIAESTADAIEALIMDAPVLIDPYGAASSKIGELFRDYLDNEEIVDAPEGDYGRGKVPTQAALDGVSSRFKLGKQAGVFVKGKRGRKKLKGKRRPSFIDTGLYEATFTAWFDK